MSDNAKVYPLKFRPIYKEKIWGGRNLERLFGRDLPAGAAIGESWELADLPQGVSVVANGPQAGKTLSEITREWGADLLGGLAGGAFPLLLKFLDANDILSLQVHPDGRAVEEIGPPAALKTECWYVVESRDGAIFKGVEPGTNEDEFRQAIENDSAEKVVRKIPVESGDFHYLPAGTVHAVGAGLVIAEVQTPSDTTYRVTDWGRGREIHVDRSMQCIRFDLTGDELPGADGETLLVTDYFTVAMGHGAAIIPAGRCVALMFLGSGLNDGQAVISHGGAVAPAVTARAGDTVLLPAGLQDAAVAAPENWKYLIITLPEVP